MILLIDNYDSFVYNLYQLIGSLGQEIRVLRNDALTLDSIAALSPDGLVLSPGPGRPEEAGICMDAVRRFTGRIPILGVCLGHQAICAANGAVVSYARSLMHGKTSVIQLAEDSRLFRGMKPSIPVGRYHSLSVVPATLPAELKVTAVAEDGEVMAVEHRHAPVFGLQFHPESILTPDGSEIIRHFLGGS